MPVTQELLNKIDEYKKADYTDDEIVQGLLKSPNYQDVAGKIKSYLNQGETPDRIVVGLKQSPMTDTQPNKQEVPPEERVEEPQGIAGFIGKTVSNVPSNAMEVAKTFVSPETYKGIGEFAKLAMPQGWLNLVIEGKDPVEMIRGLAPGILQQFFDRYGTLSNLKKYISEKPVEFGMDISSLMTGGGTLLSKAPGMGRIGKTISTVGRTIEPTHVAIKGIEKGGGLVTKMVEAPLGMSTGVGKATVAEAVKATPEFKSAIRGAVTGEEVVEKAKGGVHEIAIQRGNRYRQRLSDIKNMPNPPIMDIKQTIDAFDDVLKDFNITRVVGKNNVMKLDFSRAAIRNNPKAVADFKNIEDAINNTMKTSQRAFYKTPEGFDILKRQLDSLYSETSMGRNAVNKVSKATRQQLMSKIPEYGEMVKDYEKTTNLIKDMEATLSLKVKNPADRALRKLNQAMREDDDLRRNLIEKIEQTTGEDISALVAGRLMRGGLPTGLVGKQIAVGGILGLLYTNPTLLPTVAAASPRVVGETLMILSRGKQIAEKGRTTGTFTSPVRQTLYQVGRGSHAMESKQSVSEETQVGYTYDPSTGELIKQ